MTLRTVLFDLDGTLVDTAPDLAAALNQVRTAEDLPAMAYDAIRPHVSNGAERLIRIAFGGQPGDSRFEARRQHFLEIYRANLARESTLFDGMGAVLDTCESHGLNWGVVTNKPAWLTDPLVAALDLATRAVCVISGDTTAQRKPHPLPLLHACELAGSRPDECVYVGDAARDIEAGIRAGMHTLVALFGYIEPDDEPGTWGADDMVSEPAGILHWIERHG